MREERYGTRDLAFSRWHREIPRDDFTWIDIDHCAYCDRCKDPVYLIELARDVGQGWKATTVTRRLALKLCIPALLVFYTAEEGEITRFRVKRVAPDFGPFVTIEPAVLIEWITKVRDEHVCVEVDSDQSGAKADAA